MIEKFKSIDANLTPYGFTLKKIKSIDENLTPYEIGLLIVILEGITINTEHQKVTVNCPIPRLKEKLTRMAGNSYEKDDSHS